LGGFSNASAFGTAVDASFNGPVLGYGTSESDSDLSDNLLHSSSITTLFAALTGEGISWDPNSHHVIVLIGSTAPRAAGYSENYSVSPSDDSTTCGPDCNSSVCEPAYAFSSSMSPACEGWVESQDGNPFDSIAALTRWSPECADSLGGACTIDTITLFNGMTDPNSTAWPLDVSGGGPGSPVVVEDAHRILEAACSLAMATGGSWDGPTFDRCPGGPNGTIGFSGWGDGSTLTSSPTFLDALGSIAFGDGEGAAARGTEHPMFEFVPGPGVEVVTGSESRAACTLASGAPFPGCDTGTTASNRSGVTRLEWNWSGAPDANVMPYGALWTVSFEVIVDGPLNATVSVDACATPECVSLGADTGGDGYTGASFLASDGTYQSPSFPPAQVRIEPLDPPFSVTLSANGTGGLAPVTLRFDSRIWGGIPPYTIGWQFGDGGTSRGSTNATHTYASAGRYLAEIMVTDRIGEAVASTVSVVVGDLLTIGLATHSSGDRAPLEVQFTALYSGGWAPYGVEWVFGDGSGGNGSAPVHEYEAPGTYYGALWVRDASGQIASRPFQVLVAGSAEQALSSGSVGGVTHPACASGNGSTAFYATPTGGAAPYAYRWTFGDGAPATNASAPVHRYAANGTYEATLTLSDADGASVNQTFAVVVPSGGCPTPGSGGIDWTEAATDATLLSGVVALAIAAFVWRDRRSSR
ncbi:MAG TPA: PKD domain-containing protein, partial [Thermoplasmata archaeon]|nr:PKD domain-containing protein [Thermoplasmata archaeon]